MITSAVSLLVGRAWAMDAAVVDAMVRVAAGERLSADEAAGGRARMLELAQRLTDGEAAIADDATPHLLRNLRGERLPGTRSVTLREGVAVVSVEGVIMRRAGFFTAISGGTSTEHLTAEIRTAVESPLVSSLLLEIDSLDGAALGIVES